MSRDQRINGFSWDHWLDRENERLRDENERLREALAEIADPSCVVGDTPSRIARAALANAAQEVKRR